MKIALFSDIHANLPALEAMLADIDAQQPDAIFCLGDLVGYHVWPNEVCELIREKIFPPLPATTMMVWAATAMIVAVPTRPMKRRQMVQGPSPIPTRSSPKKQEIPGRITP